MDEDLEQLADRLGQALLQAGALLATAESCTGGWAGAVVTSVSGSSQWYERGFVTYTNAAKQEMLGVSGETLETHGAVSEPTVRAMAEGALAHSKADVSVAISGVAGPTGGTPEKPVGMVCLAWSRRDGTTASRTGHFDGDRDAVRRQAVVAALEGVLAILGEPGA